MHSRQGVNKMKTGGERFSADLAEKVHDSNVSRGNNTNGAKQQYKEHDDNNEERSSTRFHGRESKQLGEAMSKAFVVALR